MINKPFKAHALTSAIDGSDDKDIHCFNEANPCHAGLEMLVQQFELTNGQEENPCHVDPNKVTEATPYEIVIDEEEEGDSDIEID